MKKNIALFTKLPIQVLTILLLLYSSLVNAQSISKIEKVEDEATTIRDKVYKDLQKETGVSDAGLLEFIRYNIDTMAAYMVSLSSTLQNISELTSSEEDRLVSVMENHYLKLYYNFNQIKSEFPSSVTEALAVRRGPIPSGICNPACTNLDFSNGDLSSWICGYASCSAEFTFPCSNGPPPLGSFIISRPVYQIPGPGVTASAGPDPSTRNQYQVSLEKGGFDTVTGIPKVCPGYNYSAMIGDSTASAWGVAFLEQTFLITPANEDFFYNYAIVLNNPTHCYYQQPYFSVAMFDQSGDTIPNCGNYYVVAGGGNISSSSSWQYLNKGTGAEIDYLNWTSAFVSLKAYLGQCVTVQVMTSDCGKGGHYGYAYFVAGCKHLNITAIAPNVCGTPITLTAPSGGVSYQWIAPGPGCMTPAAGNTQTINATCSGKYSVIIQTVAGASCADTLDTIISGFITPPIPFFKADTVCNGQTTQFTNLTTGGTNANTYLWTFQGGATSTLANPNYTFPGPGTYTVSLKTSNGTCQNDTTLRVVVNGISIAGFKAPTACQYSSTLFTDTSKGASSWTWNFGDPSSGAANRSTIQNPTHIFSAAGTFTVTETTDFPPCSDTAKSIIVVNPSPIAKFSVTFTCFGQPTLFTDASAITTGSDTAWAWSFGDPTSGINNTSTQQNPVHTFSTAGTYLVTLTVTSNFNCQSTITVPVTIGAIPVSAFTINNACQGQPTLFSNTSSVTTGTINNWNWNLGDGTNSALQNPAHIYLTQGIFDVTLIVTTTNGCADTARDSILINPVPVAKFIATTVCQGDTTIFKDSSTINGGSISSWNWNFGDGTISSLQNPSHLYLSAGTYNVSLTVSSNTGCDSTFKLPVIVNPFPNPAFTTNITCLGKATQFTNGSTISSGSISGWSWSFGNGRTSTAQNPSITYANVGNYTVNLVTISSNKCMDSIRQIVIVAPNPVVSFSTADTSGCVTLCVPFKNASNISSGTITSWNWNFGDGNSSVLDTPIYCYSKVDTFSVSLTATSNNGCSNTFIHPHYIITYPTPVADFKALPNITQILSPTVTFLDNSKGNLVSWVWTFGDNSDSTLLTSNATHTYTDTGTFMATLAVTNNYGCIDSSKEPIQIEPTSAFYVPNAFTPNSDGLNDGFIPKAVGVIAFQMWIFDRWGQELYHCTSLTQPWDGKVHEGLTSGEKCGEDTYVWLVEFTDVYKNNHRYVGKVTIIK